MHVLALILILFAIAHSGLPFETRTILQAIVLLFWIPDIILILRKSPPFVPTFGKDLRIMLQMADIKKGDLVIDAGCGDGRLVFGASKKGATAIGYEMALPAYMYAKVRSWFFPGSAIHYGDLWKQDYAKADVVFCYLLPELMQQFHKKIWPGLKPGCKVVSNSFTIKNLTPEKSEHGVHLYIKQ